ncbi:MAG: hypothetical protein ACSHW0_15380 [Thalassotalea sp.]
MNKTIEKYLANYSECESTLLAKFPNDLVFEYSLVIPAYKESIDFIARLQKGVLAHQSTLLILVVNQPDTEIESIEQQHLYQQVLHLGENHIELADKLVLVTLANSASAILLVNRFSPAIDHKQGVGLARKVGCDIALKLIANKNIQSQYIASSDADADLPADYFLQQSKLTAKTRAAYYNFKHYCSDQTVHDATQVYEAALRYYVDGLNFALSPYAFFTIGSLLLFDATAYAQVRGFPKKAAGEDFYLLNKLAKVGTVEFIADSTITLTARLSDRVPFGTGPAVSKIIALQSDNQPYRYYHPEVFVALKQVNSRIPELITLPNDYLNWLAAFPVYIQQALLAIGFENFIVKHSSDSSGQLHKQWLVWFDAFKTLKFIHNIRDIKFENITWHEIAEKRMF